MPSKTILILSILFSALVISANPTERLPLQKTDVTIERPRPVKRQLIGRDSSGKEIYYDPQPAVVALEDGNFLLKWRSSRGEPLSVLYEPPNKIDVVVEASVVADLKNHIFKYKYRVRNLTTSKQSLGGFAVQTFSASVRPRQLANIYAGRMTKAEKVFSEGRWIRFGVLEDKLQVEPGQDIELELSSQDPPGLVECRVHGSNLMIRGAKEEMPEALEAVIPRFEIWPHGDTIGPDSRLSTDPRERKLEKLRKILPKMLQLGWVSDHLILGWYVENLGKDPLNVVKKTADDLHRGVITSEARALIESSLR